jgi:site-specific recombinase XerD
MWQDLFHHSRLVARLAEGPWQLHLDEFVAFLQEQHYKPETIRRVVCTSDQFARWLLSQNLALSDANLASVTRYRETLGRSANRGWPKRRCRLRLAVEFLTQKGIVRLPADPGLPVTPVTIWLDRFSEYLERVVGTALTTRQRYRTIVARFLQNRFGQTEPDWSQLSADDLSSFVQQEASNRRGFGRHVPSVALRSFLRFLVTSGLVRDGLTAAVPSFKQYRHAALPERATVEQVNAVLSCCQDGTSVGLRDYAVLLLLARLGLRAHEVTRLTLDDIDWRAGLVLLRSGKTRRERVLPLPADIGDALVAYLLHGRPQVSTRRIFLRAQPPCRPWCGASAVSQLVHRRLLQAGYPAHPWRGAHLFRHTVASQMVNAGATFKEVADLLGHESLNTTALYAKLDLETLQRVALPWKGGRA